MDFYNRSNIPETISTSSGEKFANVYTTEIDEETGEEKVVVCGKTNTYEYIQSFKDDCDIYNILNKFANGDINALTKTRAIYGDFTKAPASLQEANNIICKVKNEFEKLPVEVRREFDNDANKYIYSISSGKFEEVYDKFIKKSVEPLITQDEIKNEIKGDSVNG